MQHIKPCINPKRHIPPPDGRLPNTQENEESAFNNLPLSDRINPIEWIHPCANCEIPTWRVASIQKKIVYLCKTCLTILLTN